MDQAGGSSFWDSVRAWADDLGLLVHPEDDSTAEAPGPPRPTVPQAVCDSCPICQGAATFEQVNPEIVSELADLARSVVTGLASAMASASDQRERPDPGPHGPGLRAVDGGDRAPGAAEADEGAGQETDPGWDGASDDLPSDDE